MKKLTIILVLILMSTFVIGAITYGTYLTKQQYLNIDFNNVTVQIKSCGVTKTNTSLTACLLKPRFWYNQTNNKVLYKNETVLFTIDKSWLQECRVNNNTIDTCIRFAKENYNATKSNEKIQVIYDSKLLQEQLKDDWLVFSNITFE